MTRRPAAPIGPPPRLRLGLTPPPPLQLLRGPPLPRLQHVSALVRMPFDDTQLTCVRDLLQVWWARREEESVYQPRLPQCRPTGAIAGVATRRVQAVRSATVRPARRARDTKPAATPRLTAALLSAAGSRRVSGWGLHEARATARVARDQLVQVTVLTPLRVRGVFWGPPLGKGCLYRVRSSRSGPCGLVT